MRPPVKAGPPEIPPLVDPLQVALKDDLAQTVVVPRCVHELVVRERDKQRADEVSELAQPAGVARELTVLIPAPED